MRSLLVVLLSSSLAAVAGAAGGCSGSLSSTTDAGDDAGDATPGSDASKDSAVDGTTTDGGTDDAIWPADAQKLVADSPGGGFTPQPPPGSTCKYGEVHYTLDVATKGFTFQRCAAGATSTDPLVLDSGSRTIDATEYAKVDAAMKALVVATEKNCGADKGVYTVTVTSPRGASTYYDSFYACNGGGKIYVDNIDGVFSALGMLAPVK
jgi:hypothetical protein